MSNGYGPLSLDDNLNHVRYQGREYHLGCSWTNSENYIEIWGLNPDQVAGPWSGDPEIDCDAGRVTLPDEVAVKMAAAILRVHVDTVTDPITKAFRSEQHPLDNIEDRATFVKLLDSISRQTGDVPA